MLWPLFAFVLRPHHLWNIFWTPNFWNVYANNWTIPSVQGFGKLLSTLKSVTAVRSAKSILSLQPNQNTKLSILKFPDTWSIYHTRFIYFFVLRSSLIFTFPFLTTREQAWLALAYLISGKFLQVLKLQLFISFLANLKCSDEWHKNRVILNTSVCTLLSD